MYSYELIQFSINAQWTKKKKESGFIIKTTQAKNQYDWVGENKNKCSNTRTSQTD